MKRFRKWIVSLKTHFNKDKRVHVVEVPKTADTRAEKITIIKATRIFLEQNIIIN